MAKSKPLTTKQEQFLANLVAGKSKRESYRLAFGCSVASSGPAASKLLSRDHVKARLEEMEADLSAVRSARAVMSQTEKLEILAEIARRERRYDDATVSDSIRAVDSAAKIDGDLAPTKSESLNIQANGTIDQLLQALAGSSAPSTWRELDT